MQSSESIGKIMPALLKARASFKAAVKDGKNPHFKSKYVTLEGAIDAINEALLENDIFFTQPTRYEDARTVLETRLIHVSGEWIGSEYPVHPVKADPQGEGSALTYARRYALMSLVGIAPEDDDGNQAVKAVEQENEKDSAIAQEWVDALTASATLEDLEATAKDLAKANLSASAKAKARAAYSATKHRLAEKVAA